MALTVECFHVVLLLVTLSTLEQWNVDGAKGFRREGLEAHNEYRARHGAPAMNLTTALNKEAQYCAEYYLKRRTIDHTCDLQYDAGENLYLFFTTGTSSRRVTTRQGVRAWYDELYDFDCDNYVPTMVPQTLHFTQLVWKSSVELGIGVARGDGFTTVVALYYPAGNVYDQFGGVSIFRRNVQC